MEEATNSIGTLNDLVHQVLQSSQEICTRLSSLEGLLQAQNVASTHSADQCNDEEDVSTIIPRRPVHTSLLGRSILGIQALSSTSTTICMDLGSTFEHCDASHFNPYAPIANPLDGPAFQS